MLKIRLIGILIISISTLGLMKTENSKAPYTEFSDDSETLTCVNNISTKNLEVIETENSDMLLQYWFVLETAVCGGDCSQSVGNICCKVKVVVPQVY